MSGGLQNAGIYDHASVSFAATNMISLGNLMLFSADNASDDYAIWVTNGTAADTVELGGVGNAGISDAGVNFGNDLGDAVRFGNRILFAGADKNNAVGLFITDGTNSGTYEIGENADAGLTSYSQSPNATGLNPTQLFANGDEVLFNGLDSSGHYELWSSDGTASNTKELDGLTNEGADGLNPT